MTAALLAADHLALEPMLRARLESELPSVAAVGGYVEYMNLLDGKPTAMPAVFVVYDGDDLTSGTGSPHQTLLRQSWQVVVVTEPARAQAGSFDLSDTGGLLAAAIRALSGHRLHTGLKPLARVSDANPMMVGNGLLFAFLTFSQPIDMR